ncbi:tetratricopeptide repeat protein [Algoriphagus sp.]|uniref:tetratricopeptide repeat protein n=1 Tax=Algoriphagus sp. TaxID=1872435 RepID=UPI00271BA6B9|nr:tetratricopeptide repeat protein [Algoriphagus sp.]MDO8968747.1 CDC27 family protein [Algoriphagus sp.]MDP3199335.1 CDC27 family protein [Algoriphagus sp.]
MRISRFFFLFSILFLGWSPSFSQQAPSKKEAKVQDKRTKTSRYFIEGEKALVLGDLEKAYFYFQRSLEFSPKEPAINYKIAEVLVRSNQAEKGLPYAEKAALTDPNNKYYALMVAEIYTNLKQPLKAAEILDRLTADGEENQQYNLDLASIYLNAGEFDKALVVLDRAEAYFGVREPFTTQKQRIYLRKNDLRSAIREGEVLIESFPGNPNFVLNLVEILYNNARLDEALDLVLEEIQKYPNQPELHMAAYTLLKEKSEIVRANDFLMLAFKSSDLDGEIKAKTYKSMLSEMKTSNRDSLLDQMEELMLALNSKDAMVLEVIGERKKMNGEMDTAMDFYKKSLQIQPKNAPLLEQVILNSFGDNPDFVEVETFTIMGVDEFPAAPEFWFYDGVVKSARKKDSVAVVSLQRAIALNAGKNPQLDQVAFGSVANSLYNLGEKDSAFVFFDKALKLNPGDEQVLNNYAYFLSLEKRDLEKARVMSEKVVKKHPKNATYLDTYAWVLFQMGSYEEAAQYMEKALANETKPSGVMLEHYGDILYHLGKVSEAMTWWKKAEGSSEASDKLAQKIKEGKYHE